jgi:predicted TIM-barrel fold metal-dependent hydrolase
MIIDSHCHAWAFWPYQPAVPDPETRGSVAQLLFEMDQNGVDKALVVCAQIDHNPGNNAYVAAACHKHADRLLQLADLDSMWSATYHTPGAADRLRRAAEAWPLVGFTHYLRSEDDGSWLVSDDGLRFLATAAEYGLIASIHCHPHQQRALRTAAERFPQMPFLLHHLGHPLVSDPDGLAEIVKSARTPNLFVKVSGFYYATSGARWEYPFLDTRELVRAIYESYGAHRMCWGSDYPVVRQFTTYRQALEVVRTHCDFLSPADLTWVLSGTLTAVLAFVSDSRNRAR